LLRVRELSEMSEKMSKSMLDTVLSVTGSMAAPLLRSNQGKAFQSSVPGEVILATLDAISECLQTLVGVLAVMCKCFKWLLFYD
jgi:hypothetical protein